MDNSKEKYFSLSQPAKKISYSHSFAQECLYAQCFAKPCDPHSGKFLSEIQTPFLVVKDSRIGPIFVEPSLVRCVEGTYPHWGAEGIFLKNKEVSDHKNSFKEFLKNKQNNVCLELIYYQSNGNEHLSPNKFTFQWKTRISNLNQRGSFPPKK